MGKFGTVVTIDGPAASGKSSVSREIARKHGWKWVSTGAFYRGLAFVALKKNVDLEDTKALVDLCHSDEWSIELTPEKTEVVFQGVDVTDQINHEDVGSFASRISHHQDVRKALLAAQRNCALGQKGLVAEGRDCGTVVFPDAPIKVYLTAKSENRALRRALEQGADLQEVQSAQKIRDRQDSSRKAAPLQVPDNALVIDTTELDLQGVVQAVDNHIKNKLQSP
ncbi:MAG: (d)CMP kinase [Bdellovibrionaceae bacterium]|nr:(d)CMP kinase [Pseudobdellovibrionaceae bacterium]